MALKFELEGELTCKVTGDGKGVAKKGVLVAYQGNYKFEKMLVGPNNGGSALNGIFNQVVRKLTGENIPLMTVEGSGTIYLAENAAHITVINLDNDEVCVESENLLAFEEQLKYDVRFVGVGMLSQKGMITSVLKGTGKVIIKSDGNPIVIESPCCVDPNAVVAWTGSRDPGIKVDATWKTFLGQTSGESYQLDFNFPGSTVIVQPAERMGRPVTFVD